MAMTRTFRHTPEQARAIRVEAFGAIRRAAAVARGKDDLARLFTDTLPNHSAAAKYEAAGDAIRQAIRAAIGSDKA